MEVYGYKVTGNEAALRDVAEVLEREDLYINWEKFKTGDIYWAGNGDGYMVKINHETKTVELKGR